MMLNETNKRNITVARRVLVYFCAQYFAWRSSFV